MNKPNPKTCEHREKFLESQDDILYCSECETDLDSILTE